MDGFEAFAVIIAVFSLYCLTGLIAVGLWRIILASGVVAEARRSSVLGMFMVGFILAGVLNLDTLAFANGLWSDRLDRLRVAERAVQAFEQYGPTMFSAGEIEGYADYAPYADPIRKLGEIREGLRARAAPIGWAQLGARIGAAQSLGGTVMVLISTAVGWVLTAVGAAATGAFWTRFFPPSAQTRSGL